MLIAFAQAAAEQPEAPHERTDWNWRVGTRGIQFSPLDGVDLRLGGRIHYDVAEFDTDEFNPNATPIDDEADFRRVRFSLSGKVHDDWSFFAERDVAGTTVGWREAWLRYRPFDGLDFTAGNQTAPFSLDEITSSDDTLFMERALPNALAAGLYVGADARAYGEHWSASGGFFTDPLDGDPKKHSEGQGWVSRATYAPLLNEERLVQVGASLEYRSVDSGSPYRIRQRPEVGITNVRLIDTGKNTMLDVNDTLTYGLEVLSTLGPLSAQGEYIQSDLDRTSEDVSFDGWYLQSGLLLTGEHHAYNARLGRLRPITPLSRWGAVEIGGRWSTLDLNDGNVTGGVETNLMFALNWYINVNVQVMVDYGRAEAHPNQFEVDENVEILQFRLQVSF